LALITVSDTAGRSRATGTFEQSFASKLEQRLVGATHAARSAAGKNDARDAPHEIPSFALYVLET